MESDSFEAFWRLCPRRVSKRVARTAYDKALKRASPEEIINGMKKYAAWLAEAGPKNWRPHPKHPATWLNGDCWLDEYGNAPGGSSASNFLARWEANSKKQMQERGH